MTTVRLLFLAQSAEWMNQKEMVLNLPHPQHIEEMLQNRKSLAPLWAHRTLYRVAINHEIVDFKTEVRDGDEVAFLPPYSGG